MFNFSQKSLLYKKYDQILKSQITFSSQVLEFGLRNEYYVMVLEELEHYLVHKTGVTLGSIVQVAVGQARAHFKELLFGEVEYFLQPGSVNQDQFLEYALIPLLCRGLVLLLGNEHTVLAVALNTYHFLSGAEELAV
ncbi:Hypothetical_protein [Hexamita inflata]|uniref:Hypothetical_protein n=1 Tax=Hexamita inflata TaxID=28002 RepID=A0AA86QKH4_9EUKA|nr:Hypothetical protein HINF_LOCUS47578 [Hexamita inflata]